MNTLTGYSSLSIQYKAPEVAAIENEAAADQLAEDAINLTDEEKEAIIAATDAVVARVTTEAAMERKDEFAEWLDYVLPPKDERRAADFEPY